MGVAARRAQAGSPAAWRALPALRALRALRSIRLGAPRALRLSLFRDRELKILQQLRPGPHHGETPAEETVWRVIPCCTAVEQQVAVPERVRPLREHAVT